MRTPGSQAIDAPLHTMPEKMPAYQRGQRGDVLGRFLQEKKIGMMASDQASDILHPGTDSAQQIPTHHPNFGTIPGTAKSHGFHSKSGSVSKLDDLEVGFKQIAPAPLIKEQTAGVFTAYPF